MSNLVIADLSLEVADISRLTVEQQSNIKGGCIVEELLGDLQELLDKLLRPTDY